MNKKQQIADNNQARRQPQEDKENMQQRAHRSGNAYVAPANQPAPVQPPKQVQQVEKPQTVCKFEELKSEFLIRRDIGRGSYGVVFKALRVDDHDTDENGKRRQYAVKRIFPTINAAFILVEMLILKLLDGRKNVAELVQGYRLEGQVSLVFKYQKSQNFLTYLTKLDLTGIKRYMFTLLGAVEHLADLGVMHRDIKPTNFLYDTDTHTGLLIDFGLSELERDSKGQPKKHGDNDQVKKIIALQKQVKIQNRTGTKGYMPPEALFNYSLQTSAVDIWACGVIFLSFLAQRHPVFSLNNSSKVKNFTISNLIPFVCLFGSNAIKEIAFKYSFGVLIPEEMQKERLPWSSICKIHDEQAFSLLDQMLELDHNKRISATEALKHKFFDSVRPEQQ